MPRSAIIVSESFSAFIDGLLRDHECNSRGDLVYYTKSGKRITWNTHLKWAGLTIMAREPLLYAYYDKIEDPILACTTTCSICKGEAINEAHWE